MRAGYAVISVALLVGFYVFAVGIVAAIGIAGAAIGGPVGLKMLIVAAVVGFVVLRAVFWVSRPEPVDEAELEPISLRESDQPELWAEVRRLAADVETRVPDEILLVPEVNASVSEQASWLGLRGGKRTMTIGIPLLLGLNADHLRAVLAHELGHYSRSHTRLGAITYRGREQMARAMAGLEEKHPITLLAFKGYAWLYRVVSLKVSRVQELEADAAAARITSPEVATSALREVNVLAAVWSFYMGNFVGPAVAGFVRPIGIVHGFREVLHEPDRVDLLAQVRAEDPVELPSKFDSHPTFAQRAAALAKLPQGSGSTPDTRPAAALLQDADEVLEQASTAFLADNVRELKSKPWPEVAAEAGQVRTHEVAVMVSRVVREPLYGGIPTVADLLNQLSEPGDLAARFAKSIEQSEGYALPPEAHREALAEAVDGYLSWMAVATERLSWRLDWGRVTVLVDPAGSDVDFEPLLRAVVVDGAPVDGLRTRLVELGVPLSAGMRSGLVHLEDVAS